MVRLILIIIAGLTMSLSANAADCGRFKVVKGKVTYKEKGKDKFSKARINKKVCQGDLVKTEADSRAKIKMADDNEINISPKTELLIETYQNGKKAVLNVINGKVRSNVKKKYNDTNASHYRVKTKSAVAGVRGTEFLASFNTSTNQSKVVTFEGEVNVGRMQGGQIVGRVSVKPGQFTSNSPGTDPHPAKEVPPQEFAQMNQETNLDDSGSRDVSNDAGGATDPGADNDEGADDAGSDDGADQKEAKPNADKKPEPKKGANNNRPDDAGKKDPAGKNAGANGNKGGDKGNRPGGNGNGNANANGPNPKGPNGKGGGFFGDNSDSDSDMGDDFGGDGLEEGNAGGDNRGPASVGGNGDSFGGDAEGGDPLPPPSLDGPNGPGPIAGNLPKPPTEIFDPNSLIPNVDPVNNDTISNIIQNQKVNVTIIPILPGQ